MINKLLSSFFNMKKSIILITVSVLVVLSAIILFNIFNGECRQKEVLSDPVDTDIEEETYEKRIKVSQSTLGLDRECVQYKILFHKNISVDVVMSMKSRQTELKPVVYLMMLTDGEKLVGEKTMLYFVRGSGGTVCDITTNRRHIQLGGGKILCSILNVGNAQEITEKKRVVAGETWYLTIAVYRSDEEEMLCSFETSVESMEIMEINRSSKIDYFSAWDNDFSGWYVGVKILPILRFGFSIAVGLEKIITVENGLIVMFNSILHLRGKIMVELPDGKVVMDSRRMLAGYCYFGNNTGEWSFKASGIGFPRKHIVTLFYADVDPHLEII